MAVKGQAGMKKRKKRKDGGTRWKEMGERGNGE
jgi:hypothetical protein